MNDGDNSSLAPRKRNDRWLGCLVTLCIVTVAGALFFRAVLNAREAARESTCRGWLGQLQLALYSYHDIYGAFPPAYVADYNGKPMHSWRVLILPFINQADVHKRYDFSEPWDGPNNRRLHTLSNDLFHCASGPHMGASPITDYVVIVGPDTAFPGAKSTSLKEFHDGPDNTILLAEIVDSDIHWMEPRDLRTDEMSFVVNDRAKPSISSPHPRGPAVVFADRITAYRLDASLRPETLKALTTIAGGEKVSKDKLEHSDGHGWRLVE